MGRGSPVVGAPLRNLGNFVLLYHTLPVSFGRDTTSRWSLLSGVYARGSNISHIGGKCVTSRGLHSLTNDNSLNHSGTVLGSEWAVWSITKNQKHSIFSLQNTDSP